MFAFGGSGRRPARPRTPGAPPDGPGGLPADALRGALRHLLQLLDSSVSYAGGAPSFRTQTSRVDRMVSRAVDARDFEAASRQACKLRLPFTLTDGEEEASPVARVLAGCVAASVPVATALALLHVESVLGSLASDVLAGAEERGALTRYTSAMETIAEGADFVRQTAHVLRGSVADLVDTLGPLARDEPAALGRLERIRERVVSAEKVQELQHLRTMLLEETSALVADSQLRTARLGEARKRIERTAAHVQVLEAALDDARSMASTDALTGLGNRHGLEEAVAHYGSSARATGVIALDVDYFKRVNDRHGHDAGDAVLQHVAHVVSTELRGRDAAYRTGGEEFVVLLAAVEEGGARATAERLRASVEQAPVCVAGAEVCVTVSLGVAHWRTGARFSEALKRADAALYEAKRAGRNRVAG